MGNLREQLTSQMAHVAIQMRQPEPPPAPDFSRMAETHIDPLTGENDADGDEITSPEGLPPIDPKLLVGVSRNAPCPCGSGKKFKHCHGAFA